MLQKSDGPFTLRSCRWSEIGEHSLGKLDCSQASFGVQAQRPVILFELKYPCDLFLFLLIKTVP